MRFLAHDFEVTGTFSINTYTLTYKVDGEVYKEYPIEYGKEITPEAEPTKEGYKFSGWSEIPATMPAHHVEVTGTFTLLDKYKLTYIVDGQEYKSYDLAVGDPITPEAEPTKEGHTFSGWQGLPESLTMPAEDVTVTGAFAYKLTYMLDGEVYKEDPEVYYGTEISLEADPEAREGYTFSGWQGFPETNTMPAEDVTVTGTFTLIQKYKLTYILDGVEYKTFELESGESITPESNPTNDEGRKFSGWQGLPESLTMPAEDVTVTGAFAYKLTYKVDGEVYKEDPEIYYGTEITPEAEPTKKGYTFSGWSEIPATMPAHDVTVIGTFTINEDELKFTVDGICYAIGENHNVSVISKEGNYSGKVVIPSKVSHKETTYNVTGIGANAFENCSGLTSVTIPSSVTKIDKDAFKDCSGLKSVNISDLAAWCNIDFVKGSVVENAGSNSNQNPSTDPSTSEEVININVRITNNRSSAVTLDGDLQFVFANPDKNGNYHGTNDDGSPYTGTYNRSGHLRFSTSPVTIQAGQSMTFAMNNVEIGGRNPLEPSKITWTIDKRAPRNVMLYVDGNSSTVLADNMDPNIVFVNGGTYDIVIPNSNSSTRSVTTSETDNVETSTRAATGDVTTTVTIVNNSGASKTFDGRVCFITYGTYVGYTGYFRMKGTCSGASLTIPAGGSQTYTVLFAKSGTAWSVPV